MGDALVALVAFALTLALMAGRGNATRGLDVLGVVLAAIACLPLVAHRRAPLTVLAVTTAASATLNGLGYALGPPFGPTIALFYVANDDRTASRRLQTFAVLFGVAALHIGVTAITRSTTTRFRGRSSCGPARGSLAISCASVATGWLRPRNALGGGS